MTNNERIGHALVAIPIAHILGATIFLWSYCTGFGANIIVHTTAADLIGISISELSPIYALSLAYPLSLIYVMHALRESKNKNHKLLIPRALHRSIKKSKSRRYNLFLILSMPTLLALSICIPLLYYYYTGKLRFIYFWPLTFVSISIIWVLFSTKTKLEMIPRMSFLILLTYTSSLLFVGISNGQDDRYAKYNDVKSRYTLCGRAKILRQFSGKFLSVFPDDTKAIINDECKISFNIPK